MRNRDRLATVAPKLTLVIYKIDTKWAVWGIPLSLKQSQPHFDLVQDQEIYRFYLSSKLVDPRLRVRFSNQWLYRSPVDLVVSFKTLRDL